MVFDEQSKERGDVGNQTGDFLYKLLDIAIERGLKNPDSEKVVAPTVDRIMTILDAGKVKDAELVALFDTSLSKSGSLSDEEKERYSDQLKEIRKTHGIKRKRKLARLVT